MIAKSKAFLRKNAPEWNLPREGEWNFLFHNNYQPHCNNINLLWFHGRDKFPRVVTKVFRTPEIPKREFDNLSRAHAEGGDAVPRPLHFGQQEDFWMLWMEGVPGLRLQEINGSSPDILIALSNTVRSMHLAAQLSGGLSGPERNHRMIVEPLEALSQYGSAPSIADGCARLAQEFSGDWINSLPVIPQHGDLYWGNVLSHGKDLYILDWETYGLIDLPLFDLLTFFLSVLLPSGPTAEHWPAATVQQMRGLIESYSRALRLSPEDVRLLFPLSLVNWFHFQWKDGRKEFAERMYSIIGMYFQNQGLWERLISAT